MYIAVFGKLVCGYIYGLFGKLACGYIYLAVFGKLVCGYLYSGILLIGLWLCI